MELSQQAGRLLDRTVLRARREWSEQKSSEQASKHKTTNERASEHSGPVFERSDISDPPGAIQLGVSYSPMQAAEKERCLPSKTPAFVF